MASTDPAGPALHQKALDFWSQTALRSAALSPDPSPQETFALRPSQRACLATGKQQRQRDQRHFVCWHL
jgi:hypothetical protein